jgi:hypothetical protein
MLVAEPALASGLASLICASAVGVKAGVRRTWEWRRWANTIRSEPSFDGAMRNASR